MTPDTARRRGAGLLVSIALLVATSGCQRSSGSPEAVRLFAAASTLGAVEEVTAEFTRQTGVPVAINCAASSTLANMLIRGGRADLFLSASPGWSESVQQSRPGCRSVDLLKNRLVVITPASANRPGLTSLGQLVDPARGKIAMGDPQGVPAGTYARAALQQAGIWSAVQNRVAGTVDVRQALTFVEQETVKYGIVYFTDARQSRSVQIALEIKSPEPVVYPLVLLPEPTPVARQLFDFFQTEAARKVFDRYGFSTPAGTGSPD